MQSKTLAHDLFLLMLQLSQQSKEKSIVKFFLEAVNSFQDKTTYKFTEIKPQTQNKVMEIATRHNHFGWITGESITDTNNDEHDALIYNAVQMLAIILENRLQYHLLSDDKLRLETAVQKRTTELTKTNQKLLSEINERKQTEEALRRSEKNLAQAQEIAQLGSWELNTSTNEMIWSDEVYAIFGFDKSNTSPTLNNLLETMNPEDQELLNKSLSNLNEKRTLLVQTSRNHNSTKYVQFHIQTNLETKNSNFQIMGAVQDVTINKKLEEALIISEKLASLGTLAAGIAHEINSPLQVITSISDRILRLTDNNNLSTQQINTDIETIRRNAWRLASIVRALLNYARASNNNNQSCNINQLIEEVLIITEHQFRNWSNVIIQKDFEENIPNILCDNNKITQVIINILNNARDSMPEGGEITIKTRYDPKQQQIVMEISDTGCGIPEEIQKKIFDPFFTTKPIGEGTGMGLAITLGIVEAHGGNIQIKSTVGKGSSFSVYLPTKPQSESKRNTSEKYIQGRYD